MRQCPKPAREQVIICSQPGTPNPRTQGFSRLLCDFKLYRPLGFLLHDNCSRGNTISVRDIADTQLHEITGSKLAIDCKVEQREFASPFAELQSNPDGPYVLEFERGFLADELPLVPRLATIRGGAYQLVHYGTPVRKSWTSV